MATLVLTASLNIRWSLTAKDWVTDQDHWPRKGGSQKTQFNQCMGGNVTAVLSIGGILVPQTDGEIQLYLRSIGTESGKTATRQHKPSNLHETKLLGACCVSGSLAVWCNPPGSLRRRHHSCHILEMRTKRLRDRGNISQSHLWSKHWRLLDDSKTWINYCVLNSA